MFPLALSLSTLSLLVLAAHFLRAGNLLVTLTVLVVAGLLLFSRRRWVLYATQALLVLGAIMWVTTTIELVDRRIAEGGDPTRLAAILSAVVAVALGAALLLGSGAIRARYNAAPAKEPPTS